MLDWEILFWKVLEVRYEGLVKWFKMYYFENNTFVIIHFYFCYFYIGTRMKIPQYYSCFLYEFSPMKLCPRWQYPWRDITVSLSRAWDVFLKKPVWLMAFIFIWVFLQPESCFSVITVPRPLRDVFVLNTNQFTQVLA